MQKQDSNTSAGEPEPHVDQETVAASSLNQLAARTQWLEDALEAMRRDLAEDHFAAAAGHFREALCLSRGIPELKTVADKQAALQSVKLLPRNWRVAETFLQEAAATEPPLRVDADLQERLRQARYEELVLRAIHQADRAEFDGSMEQARARLNDLLLRYPNEKRLTDRLYSLDNPRPRDIPQPRPTQPAPSNQPDMAIIKAPPRTPAFRANNDSNRMSLGANAQSVIPAAALKNAKNFLTLAATSAMLGAAVFLVWQHFSATPAYSPAKQAKAPTRPALSLPASNTSPVQPVAMAPPTPAAVTMPAVQTTTQGPDEQAWQMIKTTEDAATIQSFLEAYPESPHALRAKLKLASIQWQLLDKTNPQAIEAYLKLHPRTPYRAEAQRLILENSPKEDAPVVIAPTLTPPSDRDSILEAVRKYRLGQAEITLPEPVIEGDRATLTYQPDNGPAVVYSLSRQDGIWKMETVQ